MSMSACLSAKSLCVCAAERFQRDVRMRLREPTGRRHADGSGVDAEHFGITQEAIASEARHLLRNKA
jgi:hypothetical protein